MCSSVFSTSTGEKATEDLIYMFPLDQKHFSIFDRDCMNLLKTDIQFFFFF